MATEQEKSLPSGESAWWPGWGALHGGPGGILTVAQMGPRLPRGLELGGRGAGLGPWGGWELPFPGLDPASLSLFPTHLRPQEGGPGSPGQSSGRANRTAGKQGKVAESLPPSFHSPHPPGRAELVQEFGAEVRKPRKAITSGWWKWRTGDRQTLELCPLYRPKERCLGEEGATEG